MIRRPPRSTLFPYTTSSDLGRISRHLPWRERGTVSDPHIAHALENAHERDCVRDRKSTRLNSSHRRISYAVFCLKKKDKQEDGLHPNRIANREAERQQQRED